jgi:hypothetical protein
MDEVTIARILVTIVGVIPSVAAYLQAKNYFRFKQRSVGQVVLVFLALLALLGPMVLQQQIYAMWRLPPDEYLRRLTLPQYAAALVIFWLRLKKSFRQSRESYVGGGRSA